MKDKYTEMIQTTAVRYVDEIRKYCRELSGYFNLSHFWYYKLTNEGDIVSLGTHIEWMEHFASEKFYLKYPYIRDPKYLRNSISLHREGQNAVLKEIYGACKSKFAMQQSLQIMVKTVDGVEEFGFSSESSSDQQTSIFLNDIALLRLFIERFREDNFRILRKIEDDRVNLAQMLGDDFYRERISIPVSKEKKGMFERVRIGNFEPLRVHEIETARLLVEGYSASEIAKRLHRSKRTIEHRLEKMKAKLDCLSKVDLIKKVQVHL